MSKSKKVAVSVGFDRTEKKVTAAWAGERWAATRAVGVIGKPRWSLTHIATGCAFGGDTYERSLAIRIAKMLDKEVGDPAPKNDFGQNRVPDPGYATRDALNAVVTLCRWQESRNA